MFRVFFQLSTGKVIPWILYINYKLYQRHTGIVRKIMRVDHYNRDNTASGRKAAIQVYDAGEGNESQSDSHAK